MAKLLPPVAFDFTHPEEWPNWRKRFERFRQAAKITAEEEEIQVSTLIYTMGPQAETIFAQFGLSAEDSTRWDPVIGAYDRYFQPRRNVIHWRSVFHQRYQNPEESIEAYLRALFDLAEKCDFTDKNEGIRDQFVVGIRDVELKKELQRNAALTLDLAIERSRQYELINAQVITQPNSTKVYAVTRKGQFRGRQRGRGQRGRAIQQNAGSTGSKCRNCGYTYEAYKCPAHGQKCHGCQKLGHFRSVCQSKQKMRQKQNAIHEINYEEDLADEFEHLQFSTLTTDEGSSQTEAYATIQIVPYPGRPTNLRGKVDTGAQGNIMPLRTFQQIFPKLLNAEGKPKTTTPSKTVLTAYNNTHITHYGFIKLRCSFQGGKSVMAQFFVAETQGPVIFGLTTSRDLGLVQLNYNINMESDEHKDKTELQRLKMQYPDRFTGIGKLPGTYRLVLKKDATPVIHPPRRPQIQMREKIKAELDRMTSLGVIRRITEPTDWVSSITYVIKGDGSLRICLDPNDLNNALKRGPHHTPTMEELKHKFAGATCFSKLDAKSGYWAIQLHEDSQPLTTFNTPFGRYCFQRLPFGLNVSQDLFQAAMDIALEGLTGVVSITDDIAVFGKDRAEHDSNLQKLMDRAREMNLVFNPAKCKILTEEIMFFGELYNKDGVKPDPMKVQAIRDLAPPTNTAEVQSLLGMITYLSAFIPNLSEHTTPLRLLLRKDSEFQWHPEHKKAFEKLKQLICNASQLTYYDPKMPAVIQVDASQNALGAALTQNGNVIAYASKSLTDTEKRYANIEREMLACVFGAERFDTYIFGREVIIESDHKPLEMIARKNLASAPVRLQRMLLRLQRYDYTIRYRPGKEMTLADSLSRLPISTQHHEIELDVRVCLIQFSNPRLEELRVATRQDSTLSRLMDIIFNGFPAYMRDLHNDVRPFWSFRDELCVEDGVILKGSRVIVPEQLQQQYLTEVHTGHQGITRSQQRVKSSIYWPGIDKDIEKVIRDCELCQRYQASQPPEKPLPVADDLPNVPWHTLGTDMFTLDGVDYLLVSDYYTRFPLIEKLGSDTRSERIADLTSRMFSVFGIPNTIISDNGPQFIGRAYKQMLSQFGITHITSPCGTRSHMVLLREPFAP